MNEHERQAREVEREARRIEREARQIERDAEREHRGRVGPIGPVGPFGIDLGPLADLGGEEFSEDVDATFNVERAPRVRSRNVSGETRYRRGSEGTVRVHAVKRVRGSSAEKAKRLLQNVEVRMEQNGDVIDIRPHLYEQDRGWLDLFRGGRVSVDLTITVPASSAVEAQTVSGDLSVEGVGGSVEAQSVSGDLTIRDTRGRLWVKSVSGDIACSVHSGSLEANTVSGDLEVQRCRVEQADVVSVSGDVELSGRLEPGRHRFKTVSGDVALALAEGAYEIAFRTMSGDVELETDGQVIREGRRDRTIRLGSPEKGSETAVDVRTVSGDLTVGSSGIEVPSAAEADVSAAPAPPKATPSVDPAEAARTILERVSRGELDVESAAALLDAAAAPPPPPPPGPPSAGIDAPPGLKGRILRIQVLSGGKNKVNIAIPLSLARMGKLKMGASGLVKGHLAKFGIDLEELLRTVDRSGPLVDISDNEDRVLIAIE